MNRLLPLTNDSKVQRLILRQKFLQEVDGRQVQIVVVFKRIFVNDIDDIRLYDSETLENCRFLPFFVIYSIICTEMKLIYSQTV